MKKTMIYLATLTLFILFPFTSKAATKINFVEDGNGVLNTTLHFDEGFVGGIDLRLKLSGEVSVKSLVFSDKMSKDNYTTHYTYNNGNKTLEIQIASGGVGSEHNLLNEKKELSLGKIIFGTNSKKNIEYSLDANSLTILGNNWESQSVEKDNLVLDNSQKFTYVVDKAVDKKDPVDDNKNGTTDNEEEKKPTDSKTPTQSDDTDVDGENDKLTSDNNKTDKNDKTDKDETDEKTESNNTENENNNTDNSFVDEKPNEDDSSVTSSSNLIYWLVGFGLLAIVCIIIIIVVKKRKKGTDIFE